MNSLTTKQIQEIIPHRHPFLLVDYIEDFEPGEFGIGYKCVTYREDFFAGHFPQEPVMPGVLTVESMAQTADVLLLSMPQYAGKVPLFIGIDKVKFKRKIEPGDTIEIEARVSKVNEAKAVVTCEAVAYKDGEVTTTGLVTLAMR